MKAGVRALGIAESYERESSTLAGAVVRADRVVDGLVFETCTVGGSDATDAVCRMVERLDREDLRYLLVAGIAPAWYNLLDLQAIHDRTGLPTLSVSFEESAGLESPLRAAFDGDAREWRLETYAAQPDRDRLVVNDEVVFVRHVGIDAAAGRDVVRAFTPTGGRPEPLRVARLAARAADDAGVCD